MEWRQLDSPLEGHPRKHELIYFSRKYNLHPLVLQNLFCQGYDRDHKIEAFLYPTIGGLHDPYLFRDMKKAVHRILKAIVQDESIMVFGDYDVDGVTSSAIMYKALKKNGAKVQVRLPLREDGYGLTRKMLQSFPEDTTLIITVDNGSNAHDALSAAKLKGVDVIVTDHHEIIESNPNCYAFINPKKDNETYPFADLCGAGVALKLVQALYMFLKKESWRSELLEFIELAAIGTIADMVSLTDENRVICYFGIQKMNMSPSKPLKCFFSLLGFKEIDSTLISYQLAPIINSCGRIDDPNKALEALISEHPNQDDLHYLLRTNLKRKELQMQQYAVLKETIMQQSLHLKSIIMVYGDFHKGIVGILAARVAEEFRKPAIIISADGTGSARSVQGTSFSIINVLNRCSDKLLKFGGHVAAAGLTISTEITHLKAFESAILVAAGEEVSIQSTKSYLAEFPFHSWSREVLDDFASLEPYGHANPKPLFLAPLNDFDSIEAFGKNKEHLKILIGNMQVFAFGKASQYDKIVSKEGRSLYTFEGRKMTFTLHDLF